MEGKRSKRIFYIGLFVILLTTEVLIALFVNDELVRPYLGDALVAVLLCSLIKAINPKLNECVPVGVFALALFVELGQLIGLAEMIGVSDVPVLSIALGSTFSLIDILCYALGCVLFYLTEKACSKNKKR